MPTCDRSSENATFWFSIQMGMYRHAWWMFSQEKSTAAHHNPSTRRISPAKECQLLRCSYSEISRGIDVQLSLEPPLSVMTRKRCYVRTQNETSKKSTKKLNPAAAKNVAIKVRDNTPMCLGCHEISFSLLVFQGPPFLSASPHTNR